MMDKTDKVLKMFGKSEVATVVPIGSDVIVPNKSGSYDGIKIIERDTSTVDHDKLSIYAGVNPVIKLYTYSTQGLLRLYSLTTVGVHLAGTGASYLAGSNTFRVGSSAAHASAQVDFNSTTKGFLPPRMTTAQKNAIGSPAAGLIVYDTDLNKLCVYTTAWETITSA